MRESKRPAAAGDAEGPQSADADAAAAGGAGEGASAGGDVAAARLHRAGKRKEGAADAEADAFNTRHAAEVAEFNALTKDACLGEEGKVDAAAIKQWQRDHHVAPDGKIGPKTIAAAGGKAGATDDDKVEQPNTGNADKQGKQDKKRGPVEDILEWLDLGTVRDVLQQLHMMAMSPKAGGKDDEKKEGGDAKAADPDADRDTSGIASKLAIDAFAAEVKAQKNNWERMRPQARADKMISFANEQLTGAGVPAVKGQLNAEVQGNVAGKFHHQHWLIWLNPEIFSKTRLSDDDAPHMAASVYHEARHAEQYFRRAQMLAGQAKHGDPDVQSNVAAQLDIPTKIADAAVVDKIAATDPKAAFAKRMESSAGEHDKVNREIQDQLKIYEPLRARLDAARASKNEAEIEAAEKALQQVKESVMAAWNAYAKMATEVDAFQTERAVDKALGVAPQQPR